MVTLCMTAELLQRCLLILAGHRSYVAGTHVEFRCHNSISLVFLPFRKLRITQFLDAT